MRTVLKALLASALLAAAVGAVVQPTPAHAIYDECLPRAPSEPPVDCYSELEMLIRRMGLQDTGGILEAQAAGVLMIGGVVLLVLGGIALFTQLWRH